MPATTTRRPRAKAATVPAETPVTKAPRKRTSKKSTATTQAALPMVPMVAAQAIAAPVQVAATPTPVHATRSSGDRVWSKYQLGIFDWVEHGEGVAAVDASAGSGKTTVLEEVATRIPRTAEALFCAFNSHIVKEIERRFALAGLAFEVRTIHSFGYRCLAAEFGKIGRADEWKYHDLSTLHAQRICGSDREQIAPTARILRQLVDFARNTLTDPHDFDAMSAMADHFNIAFFPEMEEFLYRATADMLAEGERMMRSNLRKFDFTDMVYLPVKFGLHVPQYDWVLVDEGQDLNAAQLALMLRAIRPERRAMFVGDPHQAIMGFAGADCDSFPHIVERTKATVLPLSVCYRCPTSHIALAQQLVPTIEARPGAPEGIVRYIKAGDVIGEVRHGDLIICRRTAPLISLCMKLIAQRKPAKVRGREIGKQLVSIVKDAATMHGYRDSRYRETFGEALSNYQSMMQVKLSARKHSEGQIEALNDKCEAVMACFTSPAFHANSADELCKEISALFVGDDERPVIMLSTIHRAKGLENERVLVLQYDTMPLEWKNQQPWEYTQELNLKYVAFTRAKRELILAAKEKAEGEDADETAVA